MNFYDFMWQRYHYSCQQLKCICAFLGILIPVMAGIIFVRMYSEGIFHSLLFVTGWITWTFIEYILHRFHMHNKNSASSLAQTHHHHHSHPTELIINGWHRSVMVLFLIGIVIIAVSLKCYFTFLSGIAFGTIGYFMIHKLLHQKIARILFKRLFRYHIYHHCKYTNTCFGISVPWWDDLFRTVPKEPKITKRIIDFYLGHA